MARLGIQEKTISTALSAGYRLIEGLPVPSIPDDEAAAAMAGLKRFAGQVFPAVREAGSAIVEIADPAGTVRRENQRHLGSRSGQILLIPNKFTREQVEPIITDLEYNQILGDGQHVGVNVPVGLNTMVGRQETPDLESLHGTAKYFYDALDQRPNMAPTLVSSRPSDTLHTTTTPQGSTVEDVLAAVDREFLAYLDDKVDTIRPELRQMGYSGEARPLSVHMFIVSPAIASEINGLNRVFLNVGPVVLTAKRGSADISWEPLARQPLSPSRSPSRQAKSLAKEGPADQTTENRLPTLASDRADLDAPLPPIVEAEISEGPQTRIKRSGTRRAADVPEHMAQT